MKFNFLLAALTVVFFTSCEKDFSEENGVTTTVTTTTSGGTTTGGGTNTNLNSCKACIYFPVCTGSIYNYSDTSASGNATNSTNTLGYIKDSVINGVTYQKISNSSQQNTFYNCTAGVTTAVVINGVSQGGTVVPFVKTTILKANDAVGATWQDVINISPAQSGTFNYSIIAKGISRTVAGTVYPDVIQVHSDALTGFAGTQITYAHSEYYFARGIGLIESFNYNDLAGGALQLHRVLLSAIIP